MLKKQFLISFISVLIIALIGVISIPILTRLLEPEEIGKLFIILALVSILQVFDGFRPVITYFLNKKRLHENETLKELKKANTLFILIISSIIFILYFVYSFNFLESFLYSLTFVFYSMMSFYWAILDTKNEINYTSILRTIGWVFAYSLFILFAFIKLNISYYILSILFMYFILFIFFKNKSIIINIKPEIDLNFRKNSRLLKIIIRDILINIKIQVNAILLVSSDKFIVPFISGYTNFAFYAVQSELATKTYIINATWRRVLFPYFAKNKSTLNLNKYLTYINFIFLLSLILCIIIGVFSKEIISIYAGKQYEDYSHLFSLLILVFPLNFIGTFGVTILQINGNFNLHNIVNRNFAILHIINLILMTYYFGIKGSAIALIISRLVDFYLYLISIDLYIKPVNKLQIVLSLLIFLSIILFIFLNKISLAIILSIVLFINLFIISKETK